METIDINEVFAQANVVENLKNVAGVDAQNALSMMTPERLAAVVGALNVKNATLPQSGNLKIAMGSGVVFMCNKYYGVTDLFIVNYGDISAFTHKFDAKKTPITYEDGCVVIKNLTNIAMPFTYKAILLS